LERCEVSGEENFRARFTIDAFSRACLLEGLDEIGMTLKYEPEIAHHEHRRLSGVSSLS
jgi:3-isopropylmalate/(R)-2-methylmalate dehydratase small subunit